METIHVVTKVQRRRCFSVEQNIRCVLESNQTGMAVPYIARKYGFSPNMLFHWRNRMIEGGKKEVAVDFARPKTDLAVALFATGLHSMKIIVQTLAYRDIEPQSAHKGNYQGP
jgi:transposase-like protein